jgi:hypothetical protein
MSQDVTILNKIYVTNEEIRATIKAPANKNVNMGVENDIALSSQSYAVPKNSLKEIVLGKPVKPGQYLFRFLTDDGFQKSYTVFVLPPTTTYNKADQVKVAKPVKGISAKFVENMRSFSEAQWQIINTKSFNKYLGSHAVSITTTFLFCITAVVEPTLWIQCGTSFAGNAKDYAMIMLGVAAEEMKTAGTLTADEYNKTKVALATADFAFSVLTGFKKVDGKIKLDGVEILAGGVSYASEMATTNEEAQTVTTLTTDFAKKVAVLVELKKKM